MPPRMNLRSNEFNVEILAISCWANCEDFLTLIKVKLQKRKMQKPSLDGLKYNPENLILFNTF